MQKALFIKTVENRKQKINSSLIPSSQNVSLYEKIIPIIIDESDAWHITDAYSWCTKKGTLSFWSMNGHIITPKEAIINAICIHHNIQIHQCLFDINHIRQVDTYNF